MKKTTILLIKFFVTIGLFYIIFTRVDVDAVAAAFSGLQWIWMPAIIFVYLLRILLQTARWKILLLDHGVDISGWILLERNWIGRFLSNFLPGRMGGDIYRVFGHMDAAVEKSKLASSVFLDRLIGIVALLTYVCVAAVFQTSMVLQTGLGNMIAISALAILLLAPWFLTHAPKRWLLRMSGRLPEGKMKKVISSLIQALIEGTQKKSTIVYAFFISILFHLLSAVASYFSLRAMGFEISLMTVILIIPLVNLIAQIPISLNGLGLREGAFTLLFTAVGVPAAVSIGAALVDRIVAVLMSLIGGVMYYSKLSRIQKQEDEQLSTER